MAETDNENTTYRRESDDKESRVAYVLGRALSLSEELKATVLELTEMLRSTSEEEDEHNERSSSRGQNTTRSGGETSELVR